MEYEFNYEIGNMIVIVARNLGTRIQNESLVIITFA